MNNNQGNYLHFRARLPPPPAFQQAGTSPYGPPVPQSGPLTSSQSYLSWGQSQHISPQIPSIGYQPPRIPPPLLPPQLPSTYFTPTHSGSFVQPPPPPPPPSSPPPGPPPLPQSSPPLNDSSHVNGSETRVKDTSDFNILSDTSPPPPKDEKIVRKIEVLCQYIAKNGQEFEEITCQKEVGNPDFEFLFGGEPGSEAAISHEYFKWMKRKCLASEIYEGGHDGNLSLKPSVVGELHEDISHSPSGSDMDMEDDITHPEESFGNENNKQAFVSNEVDTNFEKSNMNVGDADSEPSLVCKTEQISHNIINVPKEMNQLEQSPFKLIQGYASDDTSENDNDPHFENVSPVAVSPQVNQHPTLSAPVMEGFLNIKSKVPEPSTETEKLENRTNDVKQINEVQKEDNNNTVKLDVDEFGRVMKKGGNDSDSDDYYTKRRIKRGRSRSRSRSPYKRRRSRSPYERRRRKSPQRRREKRSPSRSWSPKKRGRSRSPHDRRNRNDSQEICYDFRRGRCFRGATCRFLHDRQKTVESRWHRNKQDTSFPEKEDINHNVSRSSDRLKEEFVEPPGHSADVASSHETAEHLATEHTATEMAITGQIPIGDHPLNQTSSPKPQPVNEYNLMPPVTMWNSLQPPLPPPRPPQLGVPMLQFQMNQPPFQTTYPFHLGSYPINYPILQQPAIINQNNFPRISSPNLVSSNSTIQSFLQNPASDNISDFTQSRFASHYNPYASTFDQPLTTKFNSGVFTQDYGFSANQNQTPDEGQSGNNAHNPVMSGGDQYDPLFDSIDPSSNSLKKSEAIGASEEKDEFGEVGAVENDSPTPSSPMDLPDMATMEVEIDQVKPKKSKDSRSTKLFKIAIADFVKEVLKPSWRQGNMSKEAFKTIVKKTVEKVSGAMKKHHIPKSQAKINHYIDSSQRKLTKLVMGYVDKYVKV